MSDKNTLTRTCLPPTPAGEIHVGDIVVFQTSSMPQEREERVLAVGNAMIEVNDNGTRRKLLESTDYFRLASATELAQLGQENDPWLVIVPEINRRIEAGEMVKQAVEAVFAKHGRTGSYTYYYQQRKRLGLFPAPYPNPQEPAPKTVDVKLPPDPEKVQEAFETVKRLQEEKAELQKALDGAEVQRAESAKRHGREIAALEAAKAELATELATCTRDMDAARKTVADRDRWRASAADKETEAKALREELEQIRNIAIMYGDAMPGTQAYEDLVDYAEAHRTRDANGVLQVGFQVATALVDQIKCFEAADEITQTIIGKKDRATAKAKRAAKAARKWHGRYLAIANGSEPVVALRTPSGAMIQSNGTLRRHVHEVADALLQLATDCLLTEMRELLAGEDQPELDFSGDGTEGTDV